MLKNTYKAMVAELRKLTGTETPAELLEAVKALQQAERRQRQRADATASVLVMFG